MSEWEVPLDKVRPVLVEGRDLSQWKAETCLSGRLGLVLVEG